MRQRALPSWITAVVLVSLVGLAVPAGGAFAAPLKPASDYRFLETRTSSIGSAGAATDLFGCAPTPCILNGPNPFAKEKPDGARRVPVLRFPLGNGLSVPTGGVVPNDGYSLVLYLRLDDVSGWVRLVEFKGGVAEAGLYALGKRGSGGIVFYNRTASGSTRFADDEWVQVALTRDPATDEVRGYVDGVEQWRFTDVANEAVVGGANALRLFHDGSAAPGAVELSSGAIARVRLYDVRLSPAQVGSLDQLPPKQSVTLDATSGSIGDSLEITGKNFGPAENVTLTLVDFLGISRPLGSATASKPGGFTATVTLPAAEIGVGEVMAEGDVSGLVTKRPFTVDLP